MGECHVAPLPGSGCRVGVSAGHLLGADSPFVSFLSVLGACGVPGFGCWFWLCAFAPGAILAGAKMAAAILRRHKDGRHFDSLSGSLGLSVSALDTLLWGQIAEGPTRAPSSLLWDWSRHALSVSATTEASAHTPGPGVPY